MHYIVEYSKEDRIWTVGLYGYEGHWHALDDFGSPEEAHAFINYLNGGNGAPFSYKDE